MTSASERKRNRILDAASELFGNYGYAVSMDAISKLADVSKQTIYAHFKTKDILFETCMKDKCLEYQANEGGLDVTLPIDQVLFQFARGFQEMLLKPGAQQTYRNAVANIETHPEFTETYLEYGPERTTKSLACYLQKKVDDGTIELKLSSEEAAVQLLLMFHGKAVYWNYLGCDIAQSEESKERYLRDCVEMFLAKTLKSC
ncbi:TetR/AcrR family transcriptional regulator [Vibrio sonorensis]|uniref:TetR/AcrR family transcriptional regulator n=1 Tax=Vibrio sonorensis TaxID=1004316 RepID=UPI0008D937A6|nr:TetR/AcrR family transcriptional regulator [Vibrio sonorensis]